MEYYKRIWDTLLKERLSAMGAVLIEGPKWCGKTTTARQQAASVISLQDTDLRSQYFTAATIRPSFLLEGDTPHLIDEWQDLPILWDTVRMEVDKRSMPGQFILTGSNTVDETKILHSGTGRITRMEMLPMSLWESKESNGKVSLNEVFEHPDLNFFEQSDLSVEDLIFAACRGGWPATMQLSDEKSKLFVVKDYVNTICKSDISKVDGVTRNPKLAQKILKSYARNISTLAKSTSILADVVASDNISCSRNTYEDYIAALEKLFVIQDVDAWCPAIRSKTVIQSSPKRAFCDPSVAVALLGLTPQSMRLQMKTFGFIFEQLCIRDLKAYTVNLDGHVSYYHDRYGLESDVVLHLGDGRYALIECKLGSSDIEEGAKHLLEICYLVKKHNENEPQVPIREPDILMVITGGQYAYRRDDGVFVVPIGCLKD